VKQGEERCVIIVGYTNIFALFVVRLVAHIRTLASMPALWAVLSVVWCIAACAPVLGIEEMTREKETSGNEAGANGEG